MSRRSPIRSNRLKCVWNERLTIRISYGLWLFINLLAASAPAQTRDQTPSELSGFSVSEAFEIRDGATLDVTDEKFSRVLYRVSKTSKSSLEKYENFSSKVAWEQILDYPSDYRLWVFSRKGHVTSIAKIGLPGVDRDTPIKQVYRANCLTETGQRFDVITLSIPIAWRKAEALNEPIQFTGFYYALVSSGSDDALPLFVAKRLTWFPENVNADLGVTASHVLLGQQGVDIGSLDLVRQEQNKKLESVDADIFFQFLTAVDELPYEPEVGPIGINDLLKHPHENFGNLVAFQARVKKCSVVQCSKTESNSTSLAEQGLDHYYQLIVFPDLDSQVVIKHPDKEKEDLVYRRFPVTLCCRSLPPGFSESEIENQQIWVSGFYFRFWKYGSERTDAAGVSGQLSPIIISRQPIMIKSDEASLNLLLGVVLLGLLVSLISLAWFFRNSRPRRNEALERLPVRIDFSE